MKKHFLFTLAVLFLFQVFAIAQIKEKKQKMSLGNNNALILEIPETNKKFVSKLWQTYVEDFYDSKTKWNRKENEWVTDDADIVALGLGNSVDLYAAVNQAGKNTKVTMWVDLGGAFLSSKKHHNRYLEGEKLLMRFALEVAKETTRVELEEEEKKLKKMENEFKRLELAKERYLREIERAKEIILRAEENLAQNEINQTTSQEKIATQKSTIEMIRERLNEL